MVDGQMKPSLAPSLGSASFALPVVAAGTQAEAGRAAGRWDSNCGPDVESQPNLSQFPSFTR
jgi:hypothetical protein